MLEHLEEVVLQSKESVVLVLLKLDLLVLLHLVVLLHELVHNDWVFRAFQLLKQVHAFPLVYLQLGHGALRAKSHVGTEDAGLFGVYLGSLSLVDSNNVVCGKLPLHLVVKLHLDLLSNVVRSLLSELSNFDVGVKYLFLSLFIKHILFVFFLP